MNSKQIDYFSVASAILIAFMAICFGVFCYINNYEHTEKIKAMIAVSNDESKYNISKLENDEEFLYFVVNKGYRITEEGGELFIVK